MKLAKIKRAVKHFLSSKASRKKLGLYGKGKFMRQLKRSLKGGRLVSSSQPVSASSYGYEYHGKTLSQLTGGV